jgi:hypothetical protein
MQFRTSRSAPSWSSISWCRRGGGRRGGVEEVSGQVVAAFLQVAHAVDLRPVRGLIDIRQRVQGLEDPPVVRQRLTELGRVAAVGEHPQHVVGADRAGVDGAGQAQQIRPVRADPPLRPGFQQAPAPPGPS